MPLRLRKLCERLGSDPRDESGPPIHFLRIDNCDARRLAGIDHSLEPSASGAAMIFDSWRPAADRGRGHYASAIAWPPKDCVEASGGRPAWIFSGTRKARSWRGILKPGFVYRFSLAAAADSVAKPRNGAAWRQPSRRTAPAPFA